MAGIKQQYFNPKLSGSFSGVSTFLKNRKFKDKRKVEEVLNTLREYVLHKPAPSKFKRRKVFIPFIDHQWAMDLIDMQKFKKQNKGYRYIVVIIDGFSKYLFTVPIKDKTGKTLTRIFLKILKDSKRKPNFLQVDQGVEFVNRSFQAMLKKEGITMFHTFSKLKAVLAERVIRTLRSKIERYCTHTRDTKYIDALPLLTSSYNSTYHSSIKMAPRQVSKENEADVWLNLYNKMLMEDINHPANPKLKVNDLVLISREKLTFEKGYKQNWSEEIFRVKKVNNTNPVTYTLEDMNKEEITGTFLEPELQKYNLK